MSVSDLSPSGATVADLSSYRAVHTALRIAPHRLARAVRTVDGANPADRARVRALGRYWSRFATEVHLHHTLEDDIFFPHLVARDPSASVLIERTNADHEALDELMTRSTSAFERRDHPALGPILDELARHMDAHLDFEDAEILPRFERLFSHAEFAEIEDVAVKAGGLGLQAAFTVPFVLSTLTPDELDHLKATAPIALRILYRLTKNRYARLDRRVFGTPA